jgi:hypothetical protein
MEESLLEGCIIAIVCVLVIKEVFAFIKTRKNHTFSKEDWCKVATQVSDLHRQHSVLDQDGVPVWYVRKSLEASIERLADNIERQTQALRDLSGLIKTTRDVVQRAHGE